MMRHTGGVAVAAISTRSSPFCRAMASACGGGMMPSCVPSSSITRTSRTRMRSLTRVRSSRRGPRSKAIEPPRACRTTLTGDQEPGREQISLVFLVSRHPRGPPHAFLRCGALAPHFRVRVADELVDTARAEIPARPASDRDRAVRRFAVPDDQHVGDLLELRFANFI